MPGFLACGKFQAKPDPEILQGGLGEIKEGVDSICQDFSAKKTVIQISSE